MALVAQLLRKRRKQLQRSRPGCVFTLSCDAHLPFPEACYNERVRASQAPEATKQNTETDPERERAGDALLGHCVHILDPGMATISVGSIEY